MHYENGVSSSIYVYVLITIYRRKWADNKAVLKKTWTMNFEIDKTKMSKSFTCVRVRVYVFHFLLVCNNGFVIWCI